MAAAVVKRGVDNARLRDNTKLVVESVLKPHQLDAWELWWLPAGTWLSGSSSIDRALRGGRTRSVGPRHNEQ